MDFNTTILELGGGGSTLYFGKRGANVTCLETSPEWAQKITGKCRNLNLGNVSVKVFPEPDEIACKDKYVKAMREKNMTSSLLIIMKQSNYKESSFFLLRKVVSNKVG